MSCTSSSSLNSQTNDWMCFCLDSQEPWTSSRLWWKEICRQKTFPTNSPDSILTCAIDWTNAWAAESLTCPPRSLDFKKFSFCCIRGRPWSWFAFRPKNWARDPVIGKFMDAFQAVKDVQVHGIHLSGRTRDLCLWGIIVWEWSWSVTLSGSFATPMIQLDTEAAALTVLILAMLVVFCLMENETVPEVWIFGTHIVSLSRSTQDAWSGRIKDHTADRVIWAQ